MGKDEYAEAVRPNWTVFNHPIYCGFNCCSGVHFGRLMSIRLGMRDVKQYEILVSCPSDVRKESEIIQRVFERFNSTVGKANAINIHQVHWKKDAYPESGGSPQSLLNKQIVDKSDAVIAILWTRFGTPTEAYGSGTEEEIERTLQSGKQVFLYFSDVPIPPSRFDATEHGKVKAFREKYKSRGIYTTYATCEEFEQLLFDHLLAHFGKTSPKEQSLHKTETRQVIDTNEEYADRIRGFIQELNNIVNTADVEDDCRLASIRLEMCVKRLVKSLNTAGFREDSRIVENISSTVKATYGAPRIYSIKEDVEAYNARLTVLAEEVACRATPIKRINSVITPSSLGYTPALPELRTTIPTRWTDDQRNLVAELISEAQSYWIYPEDEKTAHKNLLRIERRIELMLDRHDSDHIALIRGLERLIEVVLRRKEERILFDFTDALSKATALAQSVFSTNGKEQRLNDEKAIPKPKSEKPMVTPASGGTEKQSSGIVSISPETQAVDTPSKPAKSVEVTERDIEYLDWIISEAKQKKRIPASQLKSLKSLELIDFDVVGNCNEDGFIIADNLSLTYIGRQLLREYRAKPKPHISD